METVRIENLGSIGLIADKEPVTLPPNAWSDMQNVRCEDRSIKPFGGSDEVYEIAIDAETIVQVQADNVNYLVYAGGDSIYSLTGQTETDISGKTYNNFGWWDSNVIGGIGILNNGRQGPQYWAGTGTCQDLPYDARDPDNICTWDDVKMTAQVIRTFRYHLFAFDIDDCDGRNRRKVWWSHPAEPGEVPITWDPTLTEYDAGFVELSQTSGEIVDAAVMRDTLQIYKTDAIYSASYTGRQDNAIFNFRKVSSKGLFARNCVCDVGGRHFFVSDGDIYLYDGTNFRSIADERVKDTFFEGVNKSVFEKTFVVYYHRKGEVWLCYPSLGSLDCDTALIWDSNSDTWSKRQIPNANCAAFAIVDNVDSSATTWDELTSAGTTWDDLTTAGTSWDDLGPTIYNTSLQDALVLASVDGSEGTLFRMDAGVNTEDGSNLECYARRQALDLGDKADFHLVVSLRVFARGDPFSVRVGYQDVLTEDPTWSDYQTFTPGTDYKLDFRVSGRLHAVEFYSNADVAWEIDGYEADFVRVGRR